MGVRRQCNRYKTNPHGRNYKDVLKKAKKFYSWTNSEGNFRVHESFEMIPSSTSNGIWYAEPVHSPDFSVPEGTVRVDYDMHLVDENGNLYEKELRSSRIYSCTPSGEPDCAVGKLDVRDLWESFSDVPLSSDCMTIATAWGKFPPGTNRELINMWFEKEFQISTGDLICNMDEIDKKLLTFDCDSFNLSKDRIFSRKKLYSKSKPVSEHVR